MPKVFFIGAGPGDPDLITVKGARILSGCDTVIYAGSLVSPEILKHAKKGAKIYDSASMSLEDIINTISEAHKNGENIARLHTGDPSIFGATGEQMNALDKLGIGYEVIPGVSSLFASAAALKRELTAPEVSQTVIITRYPGKTPVPEDFRAIARAGGTLAVFLSISKIQEIADVLISEGRAPETPAAVVYKASWDKQQIIEGTLANIADKANYIKEHAIIIIGDALASDINTVSKLYDSEFTHGYRNGKA